MSYNRMRFDLVSSLYIFRVSDLMNLENESTHLQQHSPVRPTMGRCFVLLVNFLHIEDQGSYSPTILQNILCLSLHIFVYLEAFECNTTSDWLNHIRFSQSEVVLHSNLQILVIKTGIALENGW